MSDNHPDRAYLIHDNDTKFTASYKDILISEGIETIHPSYRAPQANAFAERWVRSVREECLDHILVVNENHPGNVLRENTDYYNHSRPYQGVNQRFPVSSPVGNTGGTLRRRAILGGMIHDYSRHPQRQIIGCG